MLAIPFCESFAVTWKAEVMSAAKTASPIISPHQNKGGEKRESSPPTLGDLSLGELLEKKK